MTAIKPPLALYIHWPFCVSKCPYCDFNSHVSEKIDYQAWQTAYQKELHHFKTYLSDHRITSIFFGGGTPSLMPDGLVASILEAIDQISPINDIEITLEANPSSTESDRFKAYQQAGVNRLSLGVQSLNETALTFLGRAHSKTEAIDAIALAQRYFPRYSFDLIYARPEQHLASWQQELEEALTYAGGHLSLYQLTIEKGTPFYKQHKDGMFTLPEEEESADIYQYTNERLRSHGLLAYEISNYAKPGEESQHNISYWKYEDYLGIGPGAHSRTTFNGTKHAIMMTHQPENWLKQVAEQGHGIQQQEALSADTIKIEKIMMQMRHIEGIELEESNRNAAEELAKQALVSITENRVRPTEKGFLLHHYVIEKILDDVARGRN